MHDLAARHMIWFRPRNANARARRNIYNFNRHHIIKTPLIILFSSFFARKVASRARVQRAHTYFRSNSDMMTTMPMIDEYICTICVKLRSISLCTLALNIYIFAYYMCIYRLGAAQSSRQKRAFKKRSPALWCANIRKCVQFCGNVLECNMWSLAYIYIYRIIVLHCTLNDLSLRTQEIFDGAHRVVGSLAYVLPAMINYWLCTLIDDFEWHLIAHLQLTAIGKCLSLSRTHADTYTQKTATTHYTAKTRARSFNL